MVSSKNLGQDQEFSRLRKIFTGAGQGSCVFSERVACFVQCDRSSMELFLSQNA